MNATHRAAYQSGYEQGWKDATEDRARRREESYLAAPCPRCQSITEIADGLRAMVAAENAAVWGVDRPTSDLDADCAGFYPEVLSP